MSAPQLTPAMQSYADAMDARQKAERDAWDAVIAAFDRVIGACGMPVAPMDGAK